MFFRIALILYGNVRFVFRAPENMLTDCTSIVFLGREQKLRICGQHQFSVTILFFEAADVEHTPTLKLNHRPSSINNSLTL